MTKEAKRRVTEGVEHNPDRGVDRPETEEVEEALGKNSDKLACHGRERVC